MNDEKLKLCQDLSYKIKDLECFIISIKKNSFKFVLRNEIATLYSNLKDYEDKETEKISLNYSDRILLNAENKLKELKEKYKQL